MSPGDLGGFGADDLREGEDLWRRRDVVGRPCEQVDRAGDVAQVDRATTDSQGARDELVVLKQVLDDPQVEGAGDGLRVLNQSSNLR